MVSIVVPVYNAERFLRETIACIQRQTYTNWELLLVDDCSTDGSRELIREFEEKDNRIHLLCAAENQGAARSRNQGVMASKGQYLCYLDADDVWMEEKLSKEIDFIQKKDAAFIFSGYEFADEKAVGLGKIVKVPEEITYRQALKNTIIFTSTVMFDMTKLSKDMVTMPVVASEDTATWWKILKTGITAYGLNENLVLYRRSTNTLSSNKWIAIKRIWNLYRKQEQLPLIPSMYYFICWAKGAVLRRI